MSRKRILYLDIFTIRISLLVLFGMTLLPIRAQMKRAMLVGISKYERAASESWSDIHGANDVSILTPVLKNDGFKVYVTLDQSICCIGVLIYNRGLTIDNESYKLFDNYRFKPKCSLDLIFN